MAILLVRNINNTMPLGTTQELDAASSYKRGDIVAIFDDGHEFGSKEGLPGFVRVIVTGVPSVAANQILQYKDEHIINGVTTTRRRYQIPVGVCDEAVSAGGEVTKNWGSLQSQIVDKA